MTGRTGNFMLTASGVAYYPTEPRAEDVRIEDIAAHLAKLCRYTGAVRKFYSVAEHSVLVSRLVPRQFALHGLLHDSPEAYINDLNRPTKHGPGMEGYQALERLNWVVISHKFGLELEEPPEVTEADGWALFHERAALMPPVPEGLPWGMGRNEPSVVRPELIRAWSWQDAERFFMNRYRELTA